MSGGRRIVHVTIGRLSELTYQAYRIPQTRRVIGFREQIWHEPGVGKMVNTLEISRPWPMGDSVKPALRGEMPFYYKHPQTGGSGLRIERMVEMVNPDRDAGVVLPPEEGWQHIGGLRFRREK